MVTTTEGKLTRLTLMVARSRLVDMVDTEDRVKYAADQRRTEILDNVRARLNDFPDDQMAAVNDPAAIGERMARMVPPVAGEFGRLIGPVYSTKALEAMWSVTRAAVSKKVRDKRIFALKVSGASIFPLFQFDGIDVRQDILEVVRLLEDVGIDNWTIAAWLRTPVASDEAGRTPIGLLDAGQSEVVTVAARRLGERWAA